MKYLKIEVGLVGLKINDAVKHPTATVRTSLLTFVFSLFFFSKNYFPTGWNQDYGDPLSASNPTTSLLIFCFPPFYPHPHHAFPSSPVTSPSSFFLTFFRLTPLLTLVDRQRIRRSDVETHPTIE